MHTASRSPRRFSITTFPAPMNCQRSESATRRGDFRLYPLPAKLADVVSLERFCARDSHRGSTLRLLRSIGQGGLARSNFRAALLIPAFLDFDSWPGLTS